MSLITPDFGLLFWMTVIFAIVFFILAKFGFPVITGMVHKRADRINDSIAKAKEAEEVLSSLAVRREQLVQDARKEQAEILKEAAEARDAIIAQARDRATAEADKIIENARHQIEVEKEDALRDIRRQVAVLSVEVAEKVIRKKLSDTEAQLELLDKMMDEASSADVN